MTSPSPQLFCQPDDTARDPATGITHWLATVVLLFVNDHAASHDGILAAVDRDVVHGEVQAGLALGVGLQIAKIARMPLFLIGKSVWVAFGVVVATGAGRVWRGTVPKLVDVDGMHAVWSEAFHRGGEAHFSIADRLEMDDTSGLIPLGRLQDGDSSSWFRSWCGKGHSKCENAGCRKQPGWLRIGEDFHS